MKIGLIIDTFNLGGAETMVFETARLLKESGHTPILLHFGSEYVLDCANNLEIQHIVIPNHRYYKKTALLPLFAIKGIRFLKSLELDCLHSHLFGPIIAFAPIAYMLRLRHIGTLHDVYMIEDVPKRIWLIKLAKVLNTKLVCVSKPMRDFYIQTGRFNKQDVNYIPNFSQKNAHLEERKPVRAELEIADTDIVIISVGRLVKLKRFDILIRAIALIEDRKHIKVLIAGNGPEFDALNLLVKQLGLSDSVTLLGERKDIQRLLAAADIFTLTSETEGMSKSILEALAARLPVIATDVGGNKDLVIDSKNGYIIPDHTPDSLAQKIKALCQDSTLRSEMGILSEKLLDQEYNSAIFLKRHIDIYQGALGSN